MNIYGICNFIIIWMTTSLGKKTKAKKNKKKKYLFKYFKALFVNQLRLILFTFNHLLFSINQVLSFF